jgi:hypothetical protein
MMSSRTLHSWPRAASRTAGLCSLAALVAAFPVGCVEPDAEVKPPTVEQAKPEPTPLSRPAQTANGVKGEPPKAVDAPPPGVPISDEAYRDMKRKASSRP